jgi:hypothetical protein
MKGSPHYSTAGVVTVASVMMLIGIMIGLVVYSNEIDFDASQLLAAGATILAGWMAWRAVQGQIESQRADVAEQQLDRFAIAMRSVVGAFDQLRQPNYVVTTDEQRTVAKASLQKLRTVIESADVNGALSSSLFGPDKKIVAMFVNSANMGGQGKAWGIPDKAANLVWPLYAEITKTIEQRKSYLLEGGKVDELRRLRLIDHAVAHNALAQSKIPVFDKAEQD